MTIEKFSSVSISGNNEFVNLRTFSGRGMMGADECGLNVLLPFDVDEQTLGRSLLEALRKSRWLSLEDCASFFDRDERRRVEDRWVDELMMLYGYKKRSALFKVMRSCSVIERQGEIQIKPMRHVKLEAWSGEGISKEEWVSVAMDANVRDIGSAVRLAMSRCR